METQENQNLRNYPTGQQTIFQVAEIKVSYFPQQKASERQKVMNSRQVYEVFYNNWDKGLIEFQEQCIVMFLNRANRVLGLYEASKGGLSGTVVDPKTIFSAALKCSASSIILAHNHPSGGLMPSQADIDITAKIKEGGEILDIKVLDHLIITHEGFYSFADEGRL